jgi:hypothetical protein
MRHTVGKLKQDVIRAAHIGPWASCHPWMLISAAAIAGFAMSAATFRMRDRCGAKSSGTAELGKVGDCGAGGVRVAGPRQSSSWLWTVNWDAMLGMARIAALRAIGLILTDRHAAQPSIQRGPVSTRAED